MEEEAVSAAGKSAPTSDQVSVYWGLDFERMADAVKFKLDAMERRLSERNTQGKGVVTFVCPKCNKRISSLDVDYNNLLNTQTGGLSCPTQSMATVQQPGGNQPEAKSRQCEPK